MTSRDALPAGWVWTTIGMVAETTSGGTPSRKNPAYYGGNIPWVKSGELRDGIVTESEEALTESGLSNSNAKMFPKNTSLVALYGATVGKTAILGIDAATNQAVCALFPRNNSFTPKYMMYWLRSQRDELINRSSGGAQPNISQGIVKGFPFRRHAHGDSSLVLCATKPIGTAAGTASWPLWPFDPLRMT